MSHALEYLNETISIADRLDCDAIEQMVKELVGLRFRKGRLFVIGLGGSAANASHFVNDLRKLCQIEAYAPTDNVAELTARANDEGWQTIFDSMFLNMTANDALFVLSVGGGTARVSMPISVIVRSCHEVGYHVLGIVGPDGNDTYSFGNRVIRIPELAPARVTPHTESFQSVICHCIVSHPDLQKVKTKW